MSKSELVDKYATWAFNANLLIGFVVMLGDLAISVFDLDIEPLVLYYDSVFIFVMAASIGTMLLLRVIEMF